MKWFDSGMELNSWLEQAEKKLKAAGTGSANLDSLILLEDELGKDRAVILAHPEIELSPAQTKNLNAKLKRRLKHEPMAYIRGFSEFYGRKFAIDDRVLEPRIESEIMIEMLLEQDLPKNPVIADIGTGSGAIAITVKLELPDAEVVATEIDKEALEVARQNTKLVGADITLLAGDLLKPLKSKPDVILANLPYVPNRWQINEAAGMEPRIAIFGGPDGLGLYRQMFEQIESLKPRPQLVFTECLPPQHEELTTIAKKHGYKPKESRDFIQLFTQCE